MRGGRFFELCVVAVVIVASSVLSTLAAGASQPMNPSDGNPPVGMVLEPLPGSWVNDQDVWLRVAFTDSDGVNAGSLSLTIDGHPLGVIWSDLRVIQYVAEGLSEGQHSAEAKASDQVGNGPTVVTWSFYVDTTRPLITIAAPTGNPVLVNRSVTLAWTGSDTASGIGHYEVRLDEGPEVDVGRVMTMQFSELASGVHYLSVTAYDVAGNSNSTTALATVPATPSTNSPVVVVVSEQTPLWAIALVVINAGEAAAVAWLVTRRLRGPPLPPRTS